MIKEQTCTLLFLRQEDTVLLAMKKRGFGAGLYNGAGGKLQPGETIEESLLRQGREEISVTPTAFYKVAEHDFVQDCDSAPWHLYVHAFIADDWLGKPAESDEMAPEWFRLNDIPYARMRQDDPHWLPRVLNGEKLRTIFTFDSNNQLIGHNICTVEGF